MRPDTPPEALGASWASFCAQVARAAQRAGADLKEGFEVGKDVSFDKEAGLWTVKSTDVSAEWGGSRARFCKCIEHEQLLGTSRKRKVSPASAPMPACEAKLPPAHF